ncbi:MAG TPA: 2-C-methyl-D-erythritol 4-phosphate cytidylyltransferase, partial [Bacteroidia bacterium]|nr:2-C-methyl-D-erythritol 4-phosphate cytidylyltransferase [Bacteroidia bacterium]
YSFEIPHQVVAGGQWRAQSVHFGLQHWAACTGIVAVHDAARPLASKALIALLYNEAEVYGNAIPFLPLTESIRQTDGNTNRAVNRNNYVAVQTPQCFDLQQLLSAYNEVVSYDFTDEASLFENKATIHLVPGQSNNIKITKPGDIAWAQQFLQQQNI